jgi:hypothetical protein
MPAAGVATLILVLATVAVLAAYLIRVALVLKHVNFTLGTVIAGVRAIELATRPITPILGGIAGDLAATHRRRSRTCWPARPQHRGRNR